jgi:hypothetical protein
LGAEVVKRVISIKEGEKVGLPDTVQEGVCEEMREDFSSTPEEGTRELDGSFMLPQIP